MKLADVKFYKSIGLKSDEIYFDDKKEIVFVGRSNMGKSSLLNTIFQKKDLVKTSSKPGKTRLANLFLVENKYYFTDLPGYGFAKLGKELREELDGLISWYLEERKNSIKKVVMLIDSRLGPQDSDFEMYQYILDLELPVLIVLSKSDRLSKSELKKSENYAKQKFFGQEILPISSKTKLGISELEKILKNCLN
ncbi:ribosome biogenesis GTP-binding protein YsxC [Candidatus Gracilibacteria bacterium HOT-871]|nr:ribosome biogenesis GTP-binding protein YsxC [Candidatus Gracilibacteria bacterium HOT-871]RKW21698.1 MAG: YihA family ribosome biogenesis GTP-binding protein [Candidatus Gracilibacteria bacterium]